MMKILILIILVGSTSFGAIKTSTTIHFQSLAEVSGSRMTLGELATISSENYQIEKKLSALDLGPSPQGVAILKISSRELSERLHPYASDLRSIQVKIPEEITVTRKDLTVTESGVKSKIERVIKSLLPDPSWTYEVSDINLPPVVKSIKSAGYEIIPPLSRPKGTYSFELIVIEHATPRRFWITAKVKYFALVAMMLRQVPARSHFSESDARWERKDITYMNDIPATPEDLSTGVARLIINPGMMLLRSHMEREMALHFGDQVELKVGADGISVLSKGVAQQNAFIGDTVKVRSLATNKVLDGIVIAPGVVNVRY